MLPLVMTNFNYETLGRDETQPGMPFIRLLNPTEFDKASEAIRVRLKQEYTWDFINPELWGLIGVGGGPIKKWLTLYIKESNRLRKPYYKSDISQWDDIFINTYGYDEADVHTYLRVFRQLHDEGAISDTIYKPYLYKPKDSPEAGEIVWFETRRLLYGTAGILVAGSVGYFLIKDYLIRAAKRKGR